MAYRLEKPLTRVGVLVMRGVGGDYEHGLAHAREEYGQYRAAGGLAHAAFAADENPLERVLVNFTAMTTDLKEAKLELFLQWLQVRENFLYKQVNGAQLRGCKIKYCSRSKRFGIFKSNDVPDGVLLVVPLHLAITPMRVLEDPLFGPECRSMFEEGEVDDRFLMMLFLTVERLRKYSSWKPYLDMLPTEFGNPLWFTDDELTELKGTTLHKATELQTISVFYLQHMTEGKKKNLRSLFDEKVKKLAEKLLAHDGHISACIGTK
ncbi:SET domain-containing protein [Striga asiatica]|uniref:SET domain-containing protein n=1 Tax=Striga asiatica TaxID=4170 RepID=A0A5A7RJR0_STRAF|nr:SET domain-containing protein [Striga asiatica]